MEKGEKIACAGCAGGKDVGGLGVEEKDLGRCCQLWRTLKEKEKQRERKNEVCAMLFCFPKQSWLSVM